eukprot:Seg5905.2 transcript_id=Seg5905.2/GoldUCD/mRNA.D3Y31 product="hypothetical protein" protein_id=Seg5905.2/GoldUCD/D3Y31
MSSDNEQTEPLENTPGDEPEQPDLNETLVELNSNMGAMTFLLQKLVESSFNRPTGLTETTPTGLAMNMPTGDIEGPTGSSMNRPTGHIESTGQGMLSTSSIGSNQSSAPKPGPSNERKRAATSKEHNQSEPPAKTPRDEENGDDDTISIHANEDLEQDKDEHPETGKNKDNEFLDEIAEGFEMADEVSDNVNEKLAEFVENRWGKQLKTEKIKSILEKYKRPKNCKKLHPIKVNKGVWENLKWEKKQADLRLSNMQQTLTKVGCITLQMTDFMLKNVKNFDDKSEINNQISKSYDSVALLGHLIGDLSNQRRLTMKNALKPEYQTLCSPSTEIAHSPHLFGEDIGKQIKDVEETNKITKAFKPSPNKGREQNFKPNLLGSNPQFGYYGYTPRRDFLGQGHRHPAVRKKQWGQPFQPRGQQQQRHSFRPQKKF